MILIMVIVLGMFGCFGGEINDGDVSLSTPVQMQMSTENLQSKMGLSGFILGVFLIMNAFIVVVISGILLIIKDSSVKVMGDALGMISSMFAKEGPDSHLKVFIKTISDGDLRFQIGSIGMIIGIVMAYAGAWIAM